MTESDSDSSGIERVTSENTPPESFSLVPASKDFDFKFFGPSCSKAGTKLVFLLKKDKPLPYTATPKTKKGKGTVLHL